LPPLAAAPKDVAAMLRVLQNPELGAFDDVKTLIDPDLEAMQTAIDLLFQSCQKGDLGLLYFSGHGITDDSDRLYLATRRTGKDTFRSTAVSASFIHGIMRDRGYQRQHVLILDCCYSGAFAEGWQAKGADVKLKSQLEVEGSVVLTSSTSTQKSYEDKEGELSLYTNYIVQGIESGAAESDGDGMISADELHEYAKRHVQSAKPAMKPEIYGIRQGIKIVLSRARVDAKLEYRRLVERYAENGEISFVGQDILEFQRERWELSDEVAIAIENEVLEPVRKRLKNLERYEKSLERACKQQFPLTEKILGQFKDLQEVLGLRDEDINAIQERVIAPYAKLQRQQELEVEKQGQAALEQQRKAELRKQQKLDLERHRQAELEQQRLRDAEQEKLKAEAKRQSAREAEQQRQERQRLVDFEEQRLRDAEQERLKAEVKRQLEYEAEQRRQEQQNLQSGIERPNSLELPKFPFRLSRRNFMLVAGFSGLSVVTFAAIRGNQTPTNNSTNTSTPITVVNTSQPKPFTVETGKPFKIEFDNGVNLDMVYIPSGKFTMGSPPEEKGEEDERPQIKDVNVSAFYMGKYEVTQAQWQVIMGTNPSKFKDNLQNPVEQVFCDDAQEFCKKLSQKTGQEFRLPSEAEWEYACRAGTTTAYCFGDEASLLGEYAWYKANSGSKTHAVGQKKPNVWGLYDMHGNVREWCADRKEKYGGANDLIRKTGKAVSDENDYLNLPPLRALRGGSYLYDALTCRSASRAYSRNQFGIYGFRVACVVR
jgi:formylglycine-generating enzyme required for sulfatase activity